MNYQKIAIIGPRGSGKTTISNQLSRELSLPVFHMDEIMWNENWENTPKSVYIQEHKDILKKDKWIIDGCINEEMEDRLTSADLVIYIDYPVVITTLRFVRRYLCRCFNYLLKNGKQIPEEPLTTFAVNTFKQLFFKYENDKILSTIEKLNIKKLVKLKYLGQHSLKQKFSVSI